MKKENNRPVVGKVLKPQGIKGEIKVLSLMDDTAELARIKEIYIKDTKYAIADIRTDGDFAYIKLKGINDRNLVENFREAEISVAHDSLPPLPEGRYYISDIIGCSVVSNGKTLGRISDILQYGRADIYVVQGDKDFMFPALDDVIISYDIPSKTLLVNDLELQKVAVYED